MTKIAEHYDIINRAARKGQPALLSLPRVALKDNPRRQLGKIIADERRAKIVEQGAIYKIARESPELCPPIGTSIFFKNEYGLKIRVTVKMILNGLPGTVTELFPIEDQPEHLRDPDLLKHYEQLYQIRPNWTRWADESAWYAWQEIKEQHKENTVELD